MQYIFKLALFHDVFMMRWLVC